MIVPSREDLGSGRTLTRDRLADGREILYFDDGGDAGDRAMAGLHDIRDLPRTTTSSEMRRDPLTGEWVAYAAHRQNRTFMPPPDADPLAATVPGRPGTEIPTPDYDVVVFENRFPSFSLRIAEEERLNEPVDGRPLLPRRPARGRCEVVCFTSDPHGSFKDLPVRRVRTVIDVWAHRTAELAAIDGVEHVFPFENRGEEIGVTLQHPHGQIYSYPFVPPRAAAIAARAREHRAATFRDLFEDLLTAELEIGTRVVDTTGHFAVLVPAAARWPMEIMVLPRRAVGSFPELSTAERDDLARLLPRVHQAVDRFFEGVERTPYIAAWNQRPTPAGYRGLGRLHLQLFSLMRSPGRMKYLAGSESGMGAWISDTTPEAIAARFREVW